jgi:AraC-like DNA-binding protein
LLSHYHHALTLEDIARALGCSRAHLCRKFQQATQQTPFQFLLNVRIEAAKRLLNAGAPVADVVVQQNQKDAYLLHGWVHVN